MVVRWSPASGRAPRPPRATAPPVSSPAACAGRPHERTRVKDFWPFVIAGLTTGSLYGLAAMGLVLTYKTSGIFNFAHGAVAAGAAYIFYELNTRNHMSWPLAALIVLFVVAPIAGILTERIARGLADAPPSAKIVATIGLLLMVSGTATAIFGAAAINFPQFLPVGTHRVAGVNLGED